MMDNHGIEYDLGYDLETLGDMEGARRSRRRVRRIPYDYVAKFRLTGIPGRVVRETVNISAEARFICTSIGYSLEEPTTPETPPPGPVVDIRRRVSPTGLFFSSSSLSTEINAFGSNIDKLNAVRTVEQLTALQIQNLRDALSFTYAIIDKGSGRELQNEPIHNLAGLGKPDGVRPFRELVVPYVFLPNSSIVIEIREITTIANGTIHMDFQGYKEFR